MAAISRIFNRKSKDEAFPSSGGVSDIEAEAVSELVRRVRDIEISMRGMVKESLGGEYISRFRGDGIDFEDFREYQPGDEIRAIDWNVTARQGIPHVKNFVEEREMSVFLAVDISGSGAYGSQGPSKREVMAELAAVLALSAVQGKDKVGLVLFTDELELFLPPQKSRQHCLRIIREVLFHKPERSQGSSLVPLQEVLANGLKKRSLVFVLSDFLFSEDVSQALRLASQKHDLVAVPLLDPAESNLPNVGRVVLADPETGRSLEVDTSSARVREQLAETAAVWQTELTESFQKLGIDTMPVTTDQPILPVLHRFFRGRS